MLSISCAIFSLVASLEGADGEGGEAAEEGGDCGILESGAGELEGTATAGELLLCGIGSGCGGEEGVDDDDDDELDIVGGGGRLLAI